MRWLRSFTRGRWHSVTDADDPWGQVAPGSRLITACGIPVPDYEEDAVRDWFPPGAVACDVCHERLGCQAGHPLGRCNDVCSCRCTRSLGIDDDCPRCDFEGPLEVSYGPSGPIARCPACGNDHAVSERDL